MKKINVNVPVRLMLLMNLPEQGSVLEMIAIRNLRKKIDFSSEEVEEISMKSAEGRITWNTEKAKDAEIEFSESEIEVINKVIDKLDKSGQITEALLDFIEAIK